MLAISIIAFSNCFYLLFQVMMMTVMMMMMLVMMIMMMLLLLLMMLIGGDDAGGRAEGRLGDGPNTPQLRDPLPHAARPLRRHQQARLIYDIAYTHTQS
jgi:hypothetical protein